MITTRRSFLIGTAAAVVAPALPAAAYRYIEPFVSIERPSLTLDQIRAIIDVMAERHIPTDYNECYLLGRQGWMVPLT